MLHITRSIFLKVIKIFFLKRCLNYGLATQDIIYIRHIYLNCVALNKIDYIQTDKLCGVRFIVL